MSRFYQVFVTLKSIARDALGSRLGVKVPPMTREVLVTEMENTDYQHHCQPWPEETFIAACNRAIFLYLVSLISK